jgi:hypothetical protein
MLIIIPSNGLQSLAEPRSKWRRAPQPASIVNIYSEWPEPVAFGNYRYRTFASSRVPIPTSLVADPHHFSADLDPGRSVHLTAGPELTFCFNVDPDPNPASHHDTNLQPLVYRPFTALFCASKASKVLPT